MTITVCGEDQGETPATAKSVQEGVGAIQYDPGGFIVLQRDDQHYMQAATADEGFVLEKREGSEARHFVAQRVDGREASFSAEEISGALLGYLAGQSDTPDVQWKRLIL